jgi:hypothetical protein
MSTENYWAQEHNCAIELNFAVAMNSHLQAMLQAVSHHLLCPLRSVVAVPLSGIQAYDLSG